VKHTVNFFVPKKLRILVVVALMCLLAAPVNFLLSPKTAEAQGLVPTGDWLNTVFQSITSAATYYEELKESVLDGLAWYAAKIIIEQMTSELVNWINGGGNGDPAFISDPAGFFLGAIEATAGNILHDSPLGFLCDPLKPFEAQIKVTLSNRYNKNTSGSLNRKNSSCGIDDIRDNLSGFYAGNNKGKITSWDQWLSITQIPSNNIYGATIQAELEMDAAIGGTQFLNKTTADWGQGFQSQGECTLESEETGACLQYAIVTPGSFIKDTLTNQLGLSGDSLVTADEISEIIGAIVTQLFNKVATGGLAGLSKGGNSAYTNQIKVDKNPAASVKADGKVTKRTTNGNGQQVDEDVDTTEWNNANNAVNTAIRNEFDVLYEEENARAQANIPTGGGFAIVGTQQPRLDLRNATADQICTDDFPGTTGLFIGSADQALDGSGTTASLANGCTGTPYWWNVTIPAATKLDKVEVQVNSGKYGLAGWPPAGGGNNAPPIGPFLALYPQNTAGQTTIGSWIWNASAGRFEKKLTYTGALIQEELPEALRKIPITKIQIESNRQTGADRPGLSLSEVRVFRHLLPEINASKVPTSLTQVQATDFDPTQAAWITAQYYPLYSNPAVPIDQDNIHVVITDTATQTVVQPTNTATGTYTLLPGTYQFSYTATSPASDNQTSETVTGTVRVIASPTTP